MKKAILLLSLFVFSVVAIAAVAPSKLLPTEKEVKGWKLVQGAQVEAEGEDLTKIYDGGYKLYLDHGVTEAVRDIYLKKTDVMEITIHLMKSEKAAKDFFTYWQKQLRVKSVERKNGYILFTSPKPPVGWLVSGKYLVSAVPSKEGAAAAKDAKSFLLAVQKKIAASSKHK
jgi:hypothetical protein